MGYKATTEGEEGFFDFASLGKSERHDFPRTG
jgi:hypothetical protein